MPPPIPVPVFPRRPTVTFTRNTKLQAALDAAVAAVCTRRKIAAGTYPSPISIVDLGNGTDPQPTLSFAGYRDTEEDYIASEGKVAVLYAMFALRSVVRTFAALRKPADAKDLFSQLEADANPQIVAAVPRLSLPKADLVPRYGDLFSVTKVGGSLNIAFRSEIEATMDGMIVHGRNEDTSKCVLALRYSYINGALADAGLFDKTSGKGAWVATTYAGKLPRVMIDTDNAEKSEAAASTSDAMARLMALIVLKGVLDAAACDEMKRRLKGAVGANGGDDQSWITRTDIPGFIPDAALTHDKVGLGTITAGKLRGVEVISEILALDASKIGVGASKNYAVAYQNVRNDTPSTGDMASILRDTIRQYEKP